MKMIKTIILLSLIIVVFWCVFSNAVITDSDNGIMKYYKFDKSVDRFSDLSDDTKEELFEDYVKENNIKDNNEGEDIDNNEEDSEIDSEIDNEVDKKFVNSYIWECVEKNEIINGLYNIKGYVNGELHSTTFADGGYPAVLKVDKNKEVLLDEEKIINGIEWDVECSFINNGRYVKNTYILTNKENVAKTVSLGVFVDVQIGENDYAMVERFNNNTGLRLFDEENNIQFSFYCKDVIGTTNIDYLWIGEYPDYYGHYFDNNNIQQIRGSDSAFTYSWMNRKIEPGSIVKYSTIIGMGEVCNAPKIELSSNQKYIFMQDEVSINGIITDVDKNSKASLHYIIDNKKEEHLSEQELVNNKLDFNLDLKSRNLEEGNHNIKLWAIDESGNPSTIIEKTITINKIEKKQSAVQNKTQHKTKNVQSTVQPKKLPRTGIEIVSFSIIALGVVHLYFIVNNIKKYKGIK